MIYNPIVDNIFFLKLILSFIIGGLWVVTAAIIADKFGTKIGGLVAGLPSTLLFGLLFIGWTQAPQAAIEATTVVPIVEGINTFFLITYVSQIKKGLRISLLYSLGLWIILSFSVVAISLDNFGISLLGYALMFSFSYYIFEYKLKIPSTHGKKIQYTQNQILFRGLLSGMRTPRPEGRGFLCLKSETPRRMPPEDFHSFPPSMAGLSRTGVMVSDLLPASPCIRRAGFF